MVVLAVVTETLELNIVTGLPSVFACRRKACAVETKKSPEEGSGNCQTLKFSTQGVNGHCSVLDGGAVADICRPRQP